MRHQRHADTRVDPGRGRSRVPRTPKPLVPRQRLYKQLDKAVASPLTLIVGPAGTGKTVLLSSWLEQAAPEHVQNKTS